MSKQDAVAERLLPRLPEGREWVPVRHGESGDRVYRRSDGAAYAKIATGKAARLLEGERDRVTWLAACRIGSPAVYDWIAVQDEACLVISAIPGVPASDLATPELKKAWPSIVRQLKALHELPVEACPFERRLALMFDRATDVVARDAVNPDFLAPEDWTVPSSQLLAALRTELPKRLAEEPRDLVICHGDACLPNFMVDPETHHCTGVIDLGRLGKADRYVDFSLLLGNARESWTATGDAQMARDSLFDIHAIAPPDEGRLAFYLRLDPLTWG
ncbi:APH(3'') family aminoglycoside O-phosphotransferase [Sinorhizobium sp. 7-81]|uniref:APH(3'') family aminoglycoside O-phosphotransferase n=1 Tax=Sinorhizobium sp. 8-89 TaxID=3049089 RepID=UPI0024C3C153|nr:APH(3'') family aminoglycoside O-phosphotransferase [Sinorhizobium sp. 8-89]MDK1490078.1 APH(3'') family aminoglycoside O-phosphotransferase [Sinorhizobium sp. 8-89]